MHSYSKPSLIRNNEAKDNLKGKTLRKQINEIFNNIGSADKNYL
jgi:hypothetical protein